jgi:hypothetical protein
MDINILFITNGTKIILKITNNSLLMKIKNTRVITMINKKLISMQESLR